MHATLVDIQSELARRSFKRFVLATMPSYSVNWHHAVLMDRLQAFAEGRIKRLAVFMPPQHGKSELTSRRLPAYILGINPNARIAGCSYSANLAQSFNRDVQRIIDSPEYYSIFPYTQLNSSNVKISAKGSYLRNADMFEVVGHKGFYKSVGVGGSLTGTPVDIGIIDDPVKDAVEAGSPTYRAKVWNWYMQVFQTRLHNDSQILITQTRWNEDDLSGRVLKSAEAANFEIVTLPAILDHEADKHPLDPRKQGEALWPERHGLEKLESFRKDSPRAFAAMYQQDPQPFKGGLVYPDWGKAEGYDTFRPEPIYGLDFGYSNSPAALIEVKPLKNTLLARELIYQTGVDIDPLGQMIQRLIASPRALIIADSADPILISHLRRKFGLNVRPAKKTKDSLQYGIAAIKNRKLSVHPESSNLIHELKNYRYKEDASGNPLDEPIKQFDHLLDALRYAVLHLETAKKNKIKLYA